jgi:hypothetical protein
MIQGVMIAQLIWAFASSGFAADAMSIQKIEEPPAAKASPEGGQGGALPRAEPAKPSEPAPAAAPAPIAAPAPPPAPAARGKLMPPAPPVREKSNMETAAEVALDAARSISYMEQGQSYFKAYSQGSHDKEENKAMIAFLENYERELETVRRELEVLRMWVEKKSELKGK